MCHRGRSQDESQKEPGADLGAELVTGGKKSPRLRVRKLAILSHKTLQLLAATQVSPSGGS